MVNRLAKAIQTMVRKTANTNFDQPVYVVLLFSLVYTLIHPLQSRRAAASTRPARADGRGSRRAAERYRRVGAGGRTGRGLRAPVVGREGDGHRGRPPGACAPSEIVQRTQSFDGGDELTSSHLRYSGLGDGSPLWNEIELVILPSDDDGLILYNGNADGLDLVILIMDCITRA